MPIVIELLHKYCNLLDATNQHKTQNIYLTKEGIKELNSHIFLEKRGGASMKIDSPMVDMHTLVIGEYTLNFIEK